MDRFTHFLGAVTLLLAVMASGSVKADDTCDAVKTDTALEEVKNCTKLGQLSIKPLENDKLLVLAGIRTKSTPDREEKVRKFLNQTGLKYEIKYVAWPRAYQAALTRENILIFEMDRSKERSKKFEWILPLKKYTYFLFSRDTEKFRNVKMKHQDLTEYSAVCIKDNISCSIFYEQGFPKNMVTEIIDTNIKRPLKQFELVKSKKIDLFIGSKPDHMTVKESKLYEGLLVLRSFTSEGFLAAPMHLNPRILKKLQDTATVYLATSDKKVSFEVSSEAEADIIIFPGHRLFNDKLGDISASKSSQLEHVTSILNKAGMKYFVKYLPWKRSLRESKLLKNAIILGLSKTVTREQEFFWIDSELNKNELEVHLFGHRKFKDLKLTKNDILHSNYYALCQDGKAECDLLKGFGFTDNNLVTMSSQNNPSSLEEMIIRKRADFIVGVKNDVKHNLKLLGMDTDILIPIILITKIDVFIAAPKIMNKKLLLQIMKLFKVSNAE